ncbi:CPBP family intramembrane glutamic endopeptidase [Dethiobacter alkaliphilus]|uniref:Abortive infection protein n=1 Tax=Dethiobacter alkaliphilus AHT 1 TaxID=555088 RepID=C0GD26_DETAL|nr:CPBP family intramembrane glutamic endopeptidase [Dethiobacter alkaliphilus]EEG79111.1 Abortive infection protein [Dethiobacter alkaliphilus AHT 1]
MELWIHLFIFGVTGLLIYLGIFYGVPILLRRGVPLLNAFFMFLWAPVFPLLPLSLYLYIIREGGTIGGVAERFRFTPIEGRDWIWVGVAIILTIVFDELFKPIGKYFAKKRFFAPPEFLPAPFNPLKEFTFPPKDFLGTQLKGNWKLLVVFIPLHLLAMFSEEIMWRGYMLPLQEGIFGGWAWVFNGFLWAWVVHAVLKWHFIGMLPGMLIAPLIAQHTQSTWASFLTHAVPNSILWVLLLIGVLGVGDKKNSNNSEDATSNNVA